MANGELKCVEIVVSVLKFGVCANEFSVAGACRRQSRSWKRRVFCSFSFFFLNHENNLTEKPIDLCATKVTL